MKHRLIVCGFALMLLGFYSGCSSSSAPFYGEEELEEGSETVSGLEGQSPDESDDNPGGSKPTGGGTGIIDPGGESGESGAESVEVGEELEKSDCSESPAGFGCPCDQNSDCETGWCVAGLKGNVCTKPCLENCPTGWQCKSVQNLGGDLIYVCVPVIPELCLACTADDACGAASDKCVQLGTSTVCAAGCGEDSDCPSGYSCSDSLSVDGESSLQCVPSSGSCECTPDVNGLVVACALENEVGKCFGDKTCQGEDGWTDCSAKEPLAEVCDGIDNDCDGVFDEGLVGETCEKSNEFGTCAGETECSGDQGSICDALEPGPELCDGLDNDCNGDVDEGSPDNCLTFYSDADDDGYGDADNSLCVCGPTGDYSTLESGDCDDIIKTSFPGAAESCNGIDDDCDGEIDEGAGAIGCVIYFKDGDSDGYGNTLDFMCLCEPNDDYPITQFGDCDDGNELVSIGEFESCNGVDDNCNGFTDEGCDLDDDGYCSSDLAEVDLIACPNGGGDCNDNAPQINPGQEEVCNTIDDNCVDGIDEGVQSPCGGCTPLCVNSIGDTGETFTEEGIDGMVPTEDGYLALASDAFAFNMLWVANSGEGTISRIDTETNKEVGRYTICSDPSRTAVDLDGNAWIACRGDGNVARLLIDAEECPDKNGNGIIETSTDANNDGVITPDEMVADDECVLFNKKPIAGVSKARAMGVDAENFAWVGYWNTKQLVRVDPATGDAVQTIDLPNNPYGLAIDGDGVIWVAGRSDGNHLVRVDPKFQTVQQFQPTFDAFEPYGIAVDQSGSVWIGNCCNGFFAWRFSPGEVGLNGTLDSGVWDNVPLANRPRGIVADTSGHVYVAVDQSNAVAKIDVATMTLMEYADLGESRFPVGITIDSSGFVWAVNQSGNSASKIDPDTMEVIAEVPVGSGPYTYSDMTGYALKTVTAPEGFYRHIFEGWQKGETQWVQILAQTLKPEGTKVEVRFRAGPSKEGLAELEWSEVFGPFPPAEMPINLMNQPNTVQPFLEVEVKLYSAEGGATPVLTKLEVIAMAAE